MRIHNSTPNPVGLSDTALPRLQPAMWFDGVDDYIQTGGLTTYSLPLTFTMNVFGTDELLPNASFLASSYSSPNSSFQLYSNGTDLWYLRGTNNDGSSWIYNTNGYAPFTMCSIECTIDQTTIAFRVNGTLLLSGPIEFDTPLDLSGLAFGVNRARNKYWQGVVRNIIIPGVGVWPGNGISPDAWPGGEVYGTPEKCLVHRHGQVIRTSGGQRYVVT